ncbi:hypothetical protein KIN20_029535 [Parelaphostrongylus tenuis]|uniref:Uncharacterized protein n=1 Tax=Parelaphostrongylus tenuis TaxID=148309 RepID=A0AAD5WG60_PARTN|nr:hypothetical protein KIN20_029535 [Parelaphostrongylus tenuis]
MPRSGQQFFLNESSLHAASDAESSSVIRNLAEELGVSQRTVVKMFTNLIRLQEASPGPSRAYPIMTAFDQSNTARMVVDLRHSMKLKASQEFSDLKEPE